ncbi:MAG: DUF3870 domain-containing protein [Spirochaetaceae bacterium]|jgi:hypothetical protein|nr:DUF3870 domain-containing protein [Spirochaetaceae bacterium]
MSKTPMPQEDIEKIKDAIFQIYEVQIALEKILDADCALRLELFTSFSAIFSALAQDMAEIIEELQA